MSTIKILKVWFLQSTPFANGSENVDNNKSASENMSNNSGVGNGAKDSRMDESCDDKDDQVSIQFLGCLRERERERVMRLLIVYPPTLKSK